MRFLVITVALGVCAIGAPVTDDVEVPAAHYELRVAPGDGAGVELFRLNTSKMNQSAHDGLLVEGFGIGNFYVPNRRMNESLEVLDTIKDRPVLQYTYECDGPNIRGLHVTRTMEPLLDQASVRVRLRIENKGDEDQWVAPWVRNELAPGGKFDENDRIDVPSLGGIVSAERSAYYPAARNWIAATDSATKETVYAVFNCDETHSYLALRDDAETYCGFQTSFVPRLMKKSGAWETTYRIGAVRGLTHVNFASDELAAQIDYAEKKLSVLIAPVRAMQGVTIKASVAAANGRVWQLQPLNANFAPGSVVRCTYDWEPIGDGAYDFLARISQGEKDVKLGADTGSPHGGVDAQFLVGEPKAVAYEAWTDAPHALERGKRPLTRALAANGAAKVWLESSLEKVFPEDDPDSSGPARSIARVALAKNEGESFQIVIRPKEFALDPLTIHASELTDAKTGATIEAKNIMLHRVRYYPVRVPTHFEGPTGEWPDPLPPYEPFTAPADRCSPVWVTIHAPANTPAGTYEGTIEAAAAGMDPVVITLRAEVWDFALPVTPTLKTDFGFWPENAESMSKRFGFSGTASELNAAYFANAAQHRVTLRALAQLPAESADYAASLRAYEPQLKQLLAGGATTIGVPAPLLDVPEQLRLANEFVKKNNLSARAFCQIADEPERPAWQRLFDTMTKWRTEAPDIPLMLTTHGMQPFFHEAASIWAVHTPLMDTLNNKAVLERIAAGNEVWWYVNHTPPRPYANFFIDFAAIEHRVLFWQTWALGIKGMHYWNVNYSEGGVNPFLSQLDVTPANGDGFLVYPGPNGPVNSIRWETIRDGIEDYDYLVLFRDLMKRAEAANNTALLQKVQAAYNLKEVVPDLVTFPRDPNVMLAKREAIGKAIVELRRGLDM
ncbi:MAG: DUF4091 domain-containing protein [Candidatus Hydrogenedentes bacterium]|nr:DUF4091 domain-containing protein [Candidatus Hydrogenedentota bacterium]